MRHKTIAVLIKYFENKVARTEEEQIILDTLRTESEYFPVTFLHRDDVKKLGYNSKLSNVHMRYLAKEMEYDFLEGSFWTSLESACKHMEGIE